MILVDVNLLLYVVNRDSPHHRRALAWWRRTLDSGTGVGLAWLVVLAFVRLTTRRGIFERPLDIEVAVALVDGWLALANVDIIAPTASHWPLFRNLVSSTGAAGNLTNDAHLAALAIAHGATIYSADHDFLRFPGIRHVDPLTEKGE